MTLKELAATVGMTVVHWTRELMPHERARVAELFAARRDALGPLAMGRGSARFVGAEAALQRYLDSLADAGPENANPDAEAVSAAAVAELEAMWWKWHDADSSRWSGGEDPIAATAEAERRCAVWVAGDSDDGPDAVGQP